MNRSRAILLLGLCCSALLPGREVWIQVLKDGKPVTDLNPADIQVAESSQSRAVTSIQRDARPLDVVFVVEQRRWEPPDKSIRNAILRITEGLKADDTAGLLSAGSEVKTEVPAGQPAPEFWQTLSKVRGESWIHAIGGPTPMAATAHLLDGILVGVKTLESKSAPERRRAIIVIGQNLSGPDGTSTSDAIRAAQNAGVIVTVVSFPEETMVNNPNDRPQGGRPDQEWVLMRFPRRPPPPTSGHRLDDVVEHTGGELLIDAKAKHLRQIVENLRSRFRVDYEGDTSSDNAQVAASPGGRIAGSKFTILYAKPLNNSAQKR